MMIRELLVLATALLPGQEVEALKKDEPPGYFLIPLHGVVGREIVASAIRDAMESGLGNKSTILVLEIDSPGGMISECEKIIDLLSEQRNRRTITYVRSALSAAAIISLTCDEIYLHRDALIGAATAIQQTAAGVTEVDEKFRSVWRSTCRRAAEIGGHNPLFAEAMMDSSLQLRFREEGGKKRVEQVLQVSGDDLRAGRMITVEGKLWTATGMEATRCGLARGVVNDLDGISRVASGLEGWKPVSSRGIQIMKAFANRLKSATKEIEKQMKAAQEQFDLAVEFDPNRQRASRRSRAMWLQYSKACYDHLKRCERALGKASDLARKYPIFQPHAELIKKQKEEIKKFREAIQRGARRR